MVEIKVLPKSRILLSISVSPEEVISSKDEALQILGQNIKLEGFRVGRAPANILRENVDRDKWLLETIDTAVNKKYYEAVLEIKDKYLVVGSPKIDFKSKIDFESINQGIDFTAEVDVYPEVKLPDYKKIEVKKQVVEITQKDFETNRDLLLKKRSTLKDLSGGYKAKMGDWIDIDFEVETGGEKIPDAGTKKFPLVIGNKIMVDGFEDKLIGHQAGDKFDFDLEIKSDYRDKRLAGKNVHFFVTVNEIKQLVAPEYNDDFVRELGIKGVTTTEGFKKFWLENMKSEKEREAEEKAKNEILDAIEKETNIDVPEGMVQQELDMMWHEFEHNLNEKGISTSDYLKKENISQEKIKEGWSEQAGKRVRYGLIIREIIKKEDIKVEKNEVTSKLNDRLERIKENIGADPDKIANTEKIIEEYRNKLFSENYVKQMEQEMIIDKMFEKLKEYILK